MESEIIQFVFMVSMISAFVINTMDKWKIFEKAEVYHGTKWYLPIWLIIDCIYCISFWVCQIIGLAIIFYFDKSFMFVIASIMAHPITIRIIRI